MLSKLFIVAIPIFQYNKSHFLISPDTQDDPIESRNLSSQKLPQIPDLEFADFRHNKIYIKVDLSLYQDGKF